MNARAYFQGVLAFDQGRRFRDNPYCDQTPLDLAQCLAWFEGWSTGFDITWRKLTAGQRFQMVMQTRPVALKSSARRKAGPRRGRSDRRIRYCGPFPLPDATGIITN